MILERRSQEIRKHHESKNTLKNFQSKILDLEGQIQGLKELTGWQDPEPEAGQLESRTLTSDTTARSSSPLAMLEHSHLSLSARPEQHPSDGLEMNASALPRTLPGRADLTMNGFAPNGSQDSWWQVRLMHLG